MSHVAPANGSPAHGILTAHVVGFCPPPPPVGAMTSTTVGARGLLPVWLGIAQLCSLLPLILLSHLWPCP
ncbi:hypothetical protein SUGI_0795140 [Cryptomeria japonica]|nr:hypothetical protein SUGI_0795140 [Cryptomeria japonica]